MAKVHRTWNTQANATTDLRLRHEVKMYKGREHKEWEDRPRRPRPSHVIRGRACQGETALETARTPADTSASSWQHLWSERGLWRPHPQSTSDSRTPASTSRTQTPACTVGSRASHPWCQREGLRLIPPFPFPPSSSAWIPQTLGCIPLHCAPPHEAPQSSSSTALASLWQVPSTARDKLRPSDNLRIHTQTHTLPTTSLTISLSPKHTQPTTPHRYSPHTRHASWILPPILHSEISATEIVCHWEEEPKKSCTGLFQKRKAADRRRKKSLRFRGERGAESRARLGKLKIEEAKTPLSLSLSFDSRALLLTCR